MEPHRTRRALVRVAVTVATLLAAAVPALAHTELKATAPRDGAVLAAAPTRVVVTYGEALGAPGGVRVEVAGRDVAGTPRLDPRDARRMIVPLTSAGTGAHRVTWEVVGGDGHALRGQIGFRVRGAPETVVLRRVGALLTSAAAAVRGALTAQA